MQDVLACNRRWQKWHTMARRKLAAEVIGSRPTNDPLQPLRRPAGPASRSLSMQALRSSSDRMKGEAGAIAN